ncbi:MAG: hypothetical protein JNK57_16205 [Planctomycetaceae bacterium]|nr:hypothetical protein [Planctomycetaceae bacterium]
MSSTHRATTGAPGNCVCPQFPPPFYSYTAYGTLGIYDPSGTVRTTSTYANRYTYL